MAPYIYTERNGIYIIDLQKSVGMVDDAYNAISDIAANGALTEEQIAEIREVSEEQITVNLGHSISFKSEATKEAIETYLEENFKDEE